MGKTILWGSLTLIFFAYRHLSHNINFVELNHFGHAASGLHAIEPPFQTLQNLSTKSVVGLMYKEELGVTLRNGQELKRSGTFDCLICFSPWSPLNPSESQSNFLLR